MDNKLDGAQRVFASKEAPVDVGTCEQLLRSHEQLLNEVKKDCKILKAEGSSLCNQLSPWIQLKSPVTATGNVSVYCSPVQRQDGTRFRNSIDHLDVAGSKELTSVDHVNQTLMGIDLREAHCRELFNVQQQHLRHVARRIKFEMSVREVSQTHYCI